MGIKIARRIDLYMNSIQYTDLRRTFYVPGTRRNWDPKRGKQSTQ